MKQIQCILGYACASATQLWGVAAVWALYDTVPAFRGASSLLEEAVVL